jgi:hypothetical protein
MSASVTDRQCFDAKGTVCDPLRDDMKWMSLTGFYFASFIMETIFGCSANQRSREHRPCEATTLHPDVESPRIGLSP